MVKTRPEVEQVKTIFEATQILPILSGNMDGALHGINSNWLDISKIEFHYREDLDWYLASRDQISSLLEKGELLNEKSKETVSSLIQSLIEKAPCSTSISSPSIVKQFFCCPSFNQCVGLGV